MSTQFALNALRFEDIRQAIVTYLKENNQYAGELDFTGSNIGYFIDIMAYYSMLQSYQNTLQSNNIFLDTTEIRKNAISIVKQMGYRPKRKISSKFTGSIEYHGNTTASPAQTFVDGDTITIPSRTSFTAGDYTFINKVPITLTYQNDVLLSGYFIAYEGEYKTLTYYGTGEKYQSYVIPSENVEDDSLIVKVRTTNSATSTNVQWVQADSFFTTSSDDIYFVEEDLVNQYRPKIIFGDGLIGNIPASTETVTIEYIETSGEDANGQTSISFTSTPNATYTTGSGSSFTFDVSNLIIDIPSNQVSYGGKDNETLESIQFTAPRYYSTGGRVVATEDLKIMLSDYESSLKYYNVIGGTTLYPGNEDELGYAYITAVPYFTEHENFLLNESIYLSEIEENAILPDLITKSVIATIRRFLKPTYIYLTLSPYVEVSASYTDSEIENIISTAYSNIQTYRDNNLSGLGKFYRTAQLVASLTGTTGVIDADMDITHYFSIGADTLYNTKSSSLRLPVLYQKTTEGVILYDDDNNPLTTNFIQKRSDLITTANSTLDEEDQYTQFTYPISSSSIYGSLRHKNSNRYLYNIDISRVEILTFKEEGATGQEFISYISKTFTDQNEVEWTSNLYENGTDSWQIQLNGRHIAQLKKTGSTYYIYEPDSTFLEDTVGVISETVNDTTTWVSIGSVTEVENGVTEEYYSISFLLSNTTYTDVRIYGETKLGDADFDASTFTWSWSNLKTLLDSNNDSVTFTELLATAGDEENFLNVNTTTSTDIILSVKNVKGTFSLNNYNNEFLVGCNQRNDFKMEADYTLTRNDISATDNSWEAGKSYVLENFILCSNGYICECTTAGTSGTTEPTWPTVYTYGETQTDNTVTWTVVADTSDVDNKYIEYEFSTMSSITGTFEQTITLNAEKSFEIEVDNTHVNSYVGASGASYQEFGLTTTAVTGHGLSTTTYTITVNGIIYDISTTNGETFADLVTNLNSAFTDFTASFEIDDIRITHNTLGVGYDVSITDGVSGSNPLLTALSTTVDDALHTTGIGKMASKWFHMYTPNNADHYYVWLKNGIHEKSTFTCIADVGGALDQDYINFEVIDSSDTINKYFVWYNIDGLSSAPSVTGTGIEVVLATDAINTVVASSTQIAIDTANIDVTVTANGGNPEILTIENDYPGTVDNALSVNSTGFTSLNRDAVGLDATDPKPDVLKGETWIDLPVLIRSGDAYTTIAEALKNSIDGLDDFTATRSTGTITVDCVDEGKTTLYEGDSTNEADELLYRSIFGSEGYNLLVSPFDESKSGFTFTTVSGESGGYNIDLNLERIVAGDLLTITGTTSSGNTGTFLVKEVGTETRYDLYAVDGTLKSKDVGSTCVPTGTDVIQTTIVPDGTIVIYNNDGVQALDGVGTITHYKVTSGSYGSYVVYMLDLFHDVSVGTLDYETGKLTFLDIVKGYSDFETSTPTSTNTIGYFTDQHVVKRDIKTVFDNYGYDSSGEWDEDSTTKIDIIKMIPINDYSNTGVYLGQQNDFDTIFNQCLQISINNPIIKK